MPQPDHERTLRHLFIIDPLESLLPDKDTSFVLMLAALARGHEVFTCDQLDLFVHHGRPKVRCDRSEVSRAAPHFHRRGELTADLASFDAIYMRKDPPVDQTYLHATHILSMVPQPGPLLINNPRALRDANEKLYALNFPSLIPKTLIASRIPLIRTFLDELGGEMIIKPLDGAGGRGIFYLHRDDRNLNSLLEIATMDGTQLIVAQQYIPEVRNGDKRILLLDGEPLGAVLRVPRHDDTRSNIHVGGNCVSTSLTEADQRIVANLRSRLCADGLHLVGIDVIGPYLTEVNVTSPTGIQEIEKLDRTKIAERVIDFVCARIAGQRSNP